eukprot:gene9477-9641_t
MSREYMVSTSPASSLHLASDEDDKQPPAAAFYTPPAAAAFAEHAASLASSHANNKVTAGVSGGHARTKRLPKAGIREGSRIVLVDLESVHGAVVTLEQYTGGHFTPETPAKDTFWPCTFNLSKVIMGAGMMAIPKAFMLLGLLPGLGIMALMAVLTFFTLAELVSASSSTGMGAGTSYGALVRKTVGATADKTLQPYSVPRMQRVVGTALCICNVLYLTVALCSGLVFGAELDADVLTNISAVVMGPLIGPVAAAIMANLVRCGYLMSLIGSYVLLCYPLRQCMGDLLLSGQGAVQHHWSLLTVTLVGSTYVVACYLPSIWGALSIVGATMSTVQGFIIPALVVLAVEHKAAKQAAGYQRVRSRSATSSNTSSSMSLVDSSSTLLSPLLSLPAGALPSHVLLGEQAKAAFSRSSHIDGNAGSSSAATPAAAGAPGTAAPAALPAQQCGQVARRVLRQLTAVFVLLLGIALLVNGIVDHLLDYFHPTEEGQSGNVAGRTSISSIPHIWRQLLQPPL